MAYQRASSAKGDRAPKGAARALEEITLDGRPGRRMSRERQLDLQALTCADVLATFGTPECAWAAPAIVEASGSLEAKQLAGRLRWMGRRVPFPTLLGAGRQP